MKDLTTDIASELHEIWRKTRLLENGTFDPRWKKVKAEPFVASYKDMAQLPENLRISEEGVLEIDIANSTFDQLSEDWKAENFAAAKVVNNILQDEANGLVFTEEKIGDIIHTEWLIRNEWAIGGDLDVPFSQLPEDEKAKDINQYTVGKEVMEKVVSNEKKDNFEM